MYLLEFETALDDAAAEMEACLSGPRRERYRQLRTPEARRSFLAAEFLLRAGLARIYAVDYRTVRFAVSKNGKPTLASHPEIHFNLSHSGGRAVCALSDSPVGVDLQAVTPAALRAVSRFCDAREEAWLRDRADAADAATRLWSLKEAFAKWDGRGVAAMGEAHFHPPDFSGDCPSGFAESFSSDGFWTAAFRCRTDPTLTVVRI